MIEKKTESTTVNSVLDCKKSLFRFVSHVMRDVKEKTMAAQNSWDVTRSFKLFSRVSFCARRTKGRS